MKTQTSKYNQYRAASKTLAKIIGAIETIQGTKYGANTVDLSPDGNYRLRLSWENGVLRTWTERYVQNIGFVVQQ